MDAAARRALARALAKDHGGVFRRQDLIRHGATQSQIDSEIRAERWTRRGRHTIAVHGDSLAPPALWWWSVWESGSGARLDGAAALLAHGLQGYEVATVDVAVPVGHQAHPLPGVRVRRPRVIVPSRKAGPPTVSPSMAALHAAQWAVSDRQAALVLCLVVQQRILPADRLAVAWSAVQRSRRRGLIGSVIGDLVDGAQSLGELDFALMCRRHGLPEPSRQVVRTGTRGRCYLDAHFEDAGLVVEIDGGHHQLGLNPTDDALRANHLTLTTGRVLRIPLLGLRVAEGQFLAQIASALALEQPGFAQGSRRHR